MERKRKAGEKKLEDSFGAVSLWYLDYSRSLEPERYSTTKKFIYDHPLLLTALSINST